MVYKLGTVKKYTATLYKITVSKCLPLEERSKINKSKCSVNDEKLACNMSRANGLIFEYAICNKWQYFFTGTIDRKKYDRFDLNRYRKDLSQWLRNYAKKHGTKISYLLIPERHKNGAWHFHGLLNGLPDDYLTEFIKGKHPKKLIDKGYKNWPEYAEKFGFVSVDKIKNKTAVSKYLRKYVTKRMATRNKELNAHLYYVSRGLKKAELIKKGTMSDYIIPDYENDYVKVQWVHHKHHALVHFN